MRSSNTSLTESGSFRAANMGFHEGAAMLAIAETYKTLLKAILEMLQNELDENATRIKVVINKTRRDVTILGNGWGTDQERFERALMTVGRTTKASDKLGKFGRGLVSPLGKCEYFTFTSTRRGGDGIYREWLFDTAKIKVLDKLRECVPMRERSDMRYDPKAEPGGAANWWRTKVRIANYVRDHAISTVGMAALADATLDRHRPTMARRNVVVEISITDENGNCQKRVVRAGDFQGKPLDEVTYHEPDGGDTRFRLFLSPMERGRRRGKVFFGMERDDFRVGLADFLRRAGQFQASEERKYLSDEVVQALRSGIFEGEIFSQKAKLDAERTGFTVDDAFVGWCIAIDQWYKEVGSNYYEEAKEERQAHRYQRLGLRSLQVIEGLLKQTGFTHLLAAIKEKFGKGTVGPGHVEVPGTLKTPQERKSKRANTSGRKSKEHDTGNNGGDHEPEGGSEKIDDTPLTAIGPEGVHRKPVRSNSLGLQVSFEVMPGTHILWKLDEERGMLRFNTQNPTWMKVEQRGDVVLMRFQEMCMIKALNLLTTPTEWREQVQAVMDQTAETEAFWLIHGDALAERGPGNYARQHTKSDKKARKAS